MGTFNQYYRLLQKEYDEKGNSSAKGAPFEKFVKKFLKTSPVWSSQIKNIWLWEEYPDKWSRDIGIDLVFHDHLGKKWAVQAKCYDPKYNIPKTEVDSFLSASSSKRIDRTLLIATTNLIGKNARIALEENNTTLFLKKDFEKCEYNYPSSLKASPKIKRTLFTPRPHQKTAIKDVIDGFKTNDRGQLIMACGTGKTKTSVWIDMKLKTKHTLVLVPTLNLISQTLQDWSEMYDDKIKIACVCSDRNVSKRNDEQYKVSDIPYPVYSKESDILTFLKGHGKKVVISTYLSADVFEGVFKKSNIKPFDLTIFDEAHKCTGDDSDKLTLSALRNDVVKTKKYLFMTATPRETSETMRTMAEKYNKNLYYMDDEKIYGKRFHVLNFGDAIKKRLLNDYQVVIYGIKEKNLEEFIQKRTLVKIKKDITSADELASIIGFIHSVNTYNLSKIISYHTTKDQAKNFAKILHEINDSIKPSKRITKNITINSVTSDEPVYEREIKIKNLEKIKPNKDVSILTNARCLTEGIDIPSLDCVSFISPKRSTVDIIQATGRAIRLTKPRGIGTIIVPFFISEDDFGEIDEKKLKSNYRYIFEILGALKEHDNLLSDKINEIRIELGRKKITTRGKLPSNIIINLPSDIPSNFEEKITTMVIEHNSDNWLERYGLLKKYEDEFGTVDTIIIDTKYGGVNIGRHVSNIRELYNRGTLSEQRINLYNKLNGWTFSPLDDRWNEGFKCLIKYYKKTGDANAPEGYIFDEFALGTWCSHRRSDYKKNKLSKDRIKKLKEINFSFYPKEDEWNIGFNHLKEYYKREGNSNVSSRYSINGFNLGTWVANRRTNYRNNILSRDKIQLLKSLKFIFNPLDDAFNEGLKHLADYFKINKHSNVPLSYKINNFNLGKWCHTRRRDYKAKRLSKIRIKQLKKFNFEYDLKQDYFGEGFKYLKVYYNREKTSNVPNSHVEDGFRLGNWCVKRRTQYRKGDLSDHKVKLLNSVNFHFDPAKEQWDTGFAYLQQFYKREGSSNVPSTHIENGFKLGNWVGNVRRSHKKDTLDQKKISQLKKLDFSFDVLGDQWNKYFAALLKYYKKTKRSNPPEGYIQDGLKLGNWVGSQRYHFRKNILNKDRVKKLESIDFDFNPKKK